MQILWHDTPCWDLLPAGLLAQVTVGTSISHEVREGRSHYGIARCVVEVSGQCAILDYRPFAPQKRMYNGLMKIEFTDDSRTCVKQVYWNGKPCGSAKWL
jgi:hypothetical protein